MFFDLSWGDAIVGFSDHPWIVAIVAGSSATIGLGLEEFGKYLSRRTKLRAGHILIARPCIGLGYAFLGFGALMIVLNLLSPFVATLSRFLISN